MCLWIPDTDSGSEPDPPWRKSALSDCSLVMLMLLGTFISSGSDKKEKTKQLYNTTQRNEKASTDFRTYSLNHVCEITSISTVRQIEQASNVTKSMRTAEKA